MIAFVLAHSTPVGGANLSKMDISMNMDRWRTLLAPCHTDVYEWIVQNVRFGFKQKICKIIYFNLIFVEKILWNNTTKFVCLFSIVAMPCFVQFQLFVLLGLKH